MTTDGDGAPLHRLIGDIETAGNMHRAATASGDWYG
jgi:hypothetical protein